MRDEVTAAEWLADISRSDSDAEEFDLALLPQHVLDAIEADSFWCLSRLLDGIQDNYIAGQPGIQRSVRRMAELVARIDGMSAHGSVVLLINDHAPQHPSRLTSSRKT